MLLRGWAGARRLAAARTARYSLSAPQARAPRGLPPRAVASAAAAPPADAAAAAAPPAHDDAHFFRAAIDFRFVRDNLEAVAANCAARRASADPALVARLFDEFSELQRAAEALRAARNEAAAAMKAKLEPAARDAAVARGRALKAELEGAEAALAAAESALQREGQRLPNMAHPAAPVGSEEAAALRAEVGAPRAFAFTPRDHLALGEALDLLDFETAAAVAGTKFVYLKREAALLELALISWAMHRAAAAGFIPTTTPDLVRASVLEKCGFQPRGEGTQTYAVRDSPLCLTGTAEVPLGGAVMDRTFDEAALPLRLAGFGHCFRTEAGAAGAAGRGLYRLHQFSKVELFAVATPAQSEALLEELLALEVAMYEELGLHFKVLDMPTADLGAPAHRKFDVEAWMPGLGRYGEISSASNCTDFQARRLNVRYRPATAAGGAKAKTEYAHTLNATACAVPRMLVAILENFQQEDGSVVVPEVLRPYMMGIEVIRRDAAVN
jgi:seryl-tRNA synthetase